MVNVGFHGQIAALKSKNRKKLVLCHHPINLAASTVFTNKKCHFDRDRSHKFTTAFLCRVACLIIMAGRHIGITLSTVVVVCC